MLVIPKKDYPKGLNPMGLKRGDKIELEVGDVSPDYITLDPSTMKLNGVRDLTEPREPLIKIPKPKANMANMPLPALKSAIQNPPMTPPAAAPTTPPPSMPPMK